MHRSSIDKDFVQWFEANDVIDLGFRGPKFTWQWGCLFECLDRALCNEDWRLRFKEASIFHLPCLYSDHRPILVQLNTLGASHASNRPFKFQAAWMTHELFGQFMLDKWSRSSDLKSSLSGLAADLKDWNFHVFGNVYKQKRQLVARIDGIQHYLENRQSHFLQKLEMQLRRELETILYWEELIYNSLRRNLCNVLGVRETDDLGRYLGVPLLHSRVTKATYQYIVDKVRKKLNSWNVKKLSLAGRVTLARSVLAAIPIYSMQTACIPQAVCHEVDKLCHQFIWGASAAKKKIALVSWERVQLPKEMGGLGFHNLSMLNNAFLLKLAWEISTNPHALWVQVVRSKYKVGDDPLPQCLRAYNCSNLWRNIVGYGLHFRMGCFSNDSNWHWVWKWKGPERIKYFMWLAIKDRLLTNHERLRRHLCVVDSCDICLSRVESGLHVLRDCVMASYIWTHFVPRNDWAEFFSSNTDIRNWPFLFGFICWSIWGRQNCSLFGENDLSLDSMIHVMTCKAQDWYFVASRLPGKIDSCMKTITTVSWTCPPDDVFKLNTDGSLPNSGGIACGGGLIRDSNGRWIKGFKAVFGKTSVLGVELWSILEGMKLAKSLGLKDINAESDNLIAVQILAGVLQPPGVVLSVISAIQFLLTPDWKVTFSHVLREANYAADSLAGHLHTHDFGVEVLDTPPADLVPWLMHDLVSVAYFRSV
ncbi:hypothetical protein P3X46_002268 [Hevea brasiliensis]|uniref:RNase H type-1 domain-containing protein n=1 Tax=Hevea brasiliensis TaxID=3981 RepID=A0ABQ9N4X1_HEVBR|nr:hypothetical protein P3X46_002268 [Hevea brasiliensis]